MLKLFGTSSNSAFAGTCLAIEIVNAHAGPEELWVLMFYRHNVGTPTNSRSSLRIYQVKLSWNTPKKSNDFPEHNFALSTFFKSSSLGM